MFGRGCFAAIRQLATFHAEWWDSPKLKTIDWVPLGESDLNKGGSRSTPSLGRLSSTVRIRASGRYAAERRAAL